jgi:hypothetical protein
MNQSVFGLPVVAGDKLAGYEQLTCPVSVAESAYFADGQNAGPVLARLAQAHANQDAVLVECPRVGFELWVPANQIKKGSDLL